MDDETRPYGYVYRITHVASGRRYVGATTLSPEERWHAHKSSALKAKPPSPLHRAIASEGAANFVLDVIATAADLESLRDLKALFIERENAAGYELISQGCGSGPQYRRIPNGGFNVVGRRTLSHQGYTQSAVARARISAANRDRKASHETVARMSAARKGKPQTTREKEHWATALLLGSAKCSQAVETPAGRFSSLRAAGRHHGIDHSVVRQLIKNNSDGWRYV